MISAKVLDIPAPARDDFVPDSWAAVQTATAVDGVPLGEDAGPTAVVAVPGTMLPTTTMAATAGSANRTALADTLAMRRRRPLRTAVATISPTGVRNGGSPPGGKPSRRSSMPAGVLASSPLRLPVMLMLPSFPI